MSIKSLSAVLAIASYANAISYTNTCDEASAPSNYNDCQSAMSYFDGVAGNNPDYVWEPSPGSPYNCLDNTVNDCTASICWYDGSSFTHNLVVDGFDQILQQCAPIPAGGDAKLNPDFRMGVAVFQNRTPPGKAKAKRQAKAKSQAEANRQAKVNTQANAKRQDGSSWENAYTVTNAAPNQYWQQVQDALPGGSSWALTESDARTNMVEFSVSVSESFFDLFSSEQSVSYGYSETVTYSKTETIQNTCNTGDEGYLYWTPLFTQYHGGFTNGGPSPVDIYVPMKNGDGSALGAYIVQCGAQPSK